MKNIEVIRFNYMNTKKGKVYILQQFRGSSSAGTLWDTILQNSDLNTVLKEFNDIKYNSFRRIIN